MCGNGWTVVARTINIIMKIACRRISAVQLLEDRLDVADYYQINQRQHICCLSASNVPRKIPESSGVAVLTVINYNFEGREKGRLGEEPMMDIDNVCSSPVSFYPLFCHLTVSLCVCVHNQWLLFVKIPYSLKDMDAWWSAIDQEF